MVPVGQSEDQLIVYLVFIGEVRVIDDERRAEAVWVLGFMVRVVPVRAGLVNLCTQVSHET